MQTLESIFTNKRSKLLSIADQYLQCRADAEDVVQNAYIKIKETFIPGPTGFNYVAIAVRSVALNFKGKPKETFVNIDDCKTLEAPTPAQEVCLKGIISSLPEKQRAVIEAYCNGISIKNFAQLNGLSAESVKSRFLSGIKKLKELEMNKETKSEINVPVTLGLLLRSLRLENGDTLKQFSEKLEIPMQTLSGMEHGKLKIYFDQAAKFARLLGYSETRFVELTIQETLNQSGLEHFKVKLNEHSS